jgi:hypothetical protein
MLVPSFGPTMNVIAYSPFQDGVSAEAVCGSDSAIASGAAHKPTRVLRQSGATGLSSRLATAFELGCAATTLDAHTYTLLPAESVNRNWLAPPGRRFTTQVVGGGQAVVGGPDRHDSPLTCIFDALEGVDLFDAEETT